MPGPGKKGKKANKSNQSSNSASSSRSGPTQSFHLNQIDDKEEWKVLICRLCEVFSLPDLQSRSGLKKIHADFNAIYDKMDKLFQESQEHLRIRGAIIGIFGKMSIDSLLRNKLLEKDLLGKIIPLTQEDETRHLALRALDTITHHGGAHGRMEVAKHSNVIAKLIDDLPDDDVVAELGVAILAHSVVAVVAGDEVPANPGILKSIDMVKVLRSVLDALKRFHTKCLPIIDHGIHLFAASTLHASGAFKLYPPALGFLAAGLRSEDWACRSACLGGLVRAYQLEAEEDFNQFDAMRFVSVYQTSGVPRHLDRILMAYGPQECTLYLSLSCTLESQKVMFAYANSRERDLYALGLKQAALLTKTEYSIADGTFQVQDPRTGNFVTDEDLNMPFTQWKDSLKHTAKAIRNKGRPNEAYLADMLEIKYLIGKRVLSKAMELANKGLERNPEQGYFYYALSLTGDAVQGLRAAKKGLKCRQNTPYIRHQLLQRAVDHAGDLGVKVLQAMPESGNKQWEEGVAFVMSAIEDAKRYLKEAPPDSRHTRNVGQWLILLTLLANPDTNPNLKEFDEILKKIDVADEFTTLMGGRPPPKTNLRLAQKSLIKHYPSGAAQFSHIFAHFDKLKSTDAPPKKPVEIDTDIVAWLEDMTVEDGYLNEVVQDCLNTFKQSLNVSDGALALYRCSWCGNPSAVLRKCGGCSTSRYCDSACQKADWKGHKKTCGQDAQLTQSESLDSLD